MKLFTPLQNSLMALMLLLISCSSDNDAPNVRLTTPNTTGKPLVEVTHAGNLPQTFDWTVGYNRGQLVSATGTYRFGTNTESVRRASIFYSPRGISVKTDNNEAITIQTNSSNFIEKMSVNGNDFTFSYTNGFLTQWTEIVKKNDLGGTVSYISTATLSYDINGNLKTIAYIKNSDYPKYVRTLSFTPSDRLNVNGLLPEGISAEMGCLGFEYLYYAGALGKATNHLVKSINVVNAEKPEDDFILNFNYVADANGNITYCSYYYKNMPAGATYKY